MRSPRWILRSPLASTIGRQQTFWRVMRAPRKTELDGGGAVLVDLAVDVIEYELDF